MSETLLIVAAASLTPITLLILLRFGLVGGQTKDLAQKQMELEGRRMELDAHRHQREMEIEAKRLAQEQAKLDQESRKLALAEEQMAMQKEKHELEIKLQRVRQAQAETGSRPGRMVTSAMLERGGM